MRFPESSDLLSPACVATIRATFASLRLGTDLSERQSAEINATRPTRSGARDFTAFARENLLKQIRIEHMRRGGSDPRKPSDLQASLKPFATSVMPLLVPKVA